MRKSFDKDDIRQVVDDFLRVIQIAITDSGVSLTTAERLAAQAAVLAGVIAFKAQDMQDGEWLVSEDDPPQLF